MTTNVRAARESDELVDWLQIMTTERFRHLPIVDEQGKLVNMMSQGGFRVLYMARSVRSHAQGC